MQQVAYKINESEMDGIELTPDLADIIYGKDPSTAKPKSEERKVADAPVAEMHQVAEDVEVEDKEKKQEFVISFDIGFDTAKKVVAPKLPPPQRKPFVQTRRSVDSSQNEAPAAL